MLRPSPDLNMLIPPGYQITDYFPAQSAIVQVASGAGVSVAPQVVLSAYIHPGAKAYLQNFSVRVIDMAAYDQLIFALRRNGGLISPWDRISGEQITEDFMIPVETAFDGGLLELVATNISGQDTTIYSGASPDALSVRVIARWKGFTLSPIRMAFNA